MEELGIEYREDIAGTGVQKNVRTFDTANMGGEDFSWYLEQILDEDALAVGAAYYSVPTTWPFESTLATRRSKRSTGAPTRV